VSATLTLVRERESARLRAPENAVLLIGVAGAVAGLGAANGGYFAASWGWSALALLWLALAALALRASVRVTRLELSFVGLVAALVGWIWLSLLWTSDFSATVLEGERGLVLVAASAAILALARTGATRTLVAATLVGITVDCAYALATRLFPSSIGSYDSVAVYRLSTPVGYWNGLGVFAALGIVLALGFAARARAPITRALAGASLLVLVPTLYFTFSRGAWLALAIGLVVLVAFDPRRLQLLVVLLALAPAPVLAVALASHSSALTHQNATLARAAHDGHRLAVALALLALLAAAAVLVVDALEQRLTPPRGARIAFASAVAAVAAALVVVALVEYGSPPTIARKAYHSFVAPPPQSTANLNKRLFNLSGNGRSQLWHVAWRDAQAHELLGSGAGSYTRYYARHRSTTLNVKDAHNLYLETLAELGPLGLALLVTMLGLPLVAAVRNRHARCVPFAAAAYTVYLVHAIVDWDWELAGVTLAALACGWACVLAERDDDAPARELSLAARAASGVALAAVSAVALVGLLGNSALESSDAAMRAGRWQAAEADAHKAIRWTPWSAAGWQRLAEAQLGAGRRAEARRTLQRALAKDRGNWVLWLDLAAATRDQAQITALNEAIRLNPLASEIGPFMSAVLRQ
jgi:tetratricopeptide (TPR) repeat protein